MIFTKKMSIHIIEFSGKKQLGMMTEEIFVMWKKKGPLKVTGRGKVCH